jgi:hypothetical protein
MQEVVGSMATDQYGLVLSSALHSPPLCWAAHHVRDSAVQGSPTLIRGHELRLRGPSLSIPEPQPSRHLGVRVPAGRSVALDRGVWPPVTSDKQWVAGFGAPLHSLPFQNRNCPGTAGSGYHPAGAGMSGSDSSMAGRVRGRARWARNNAHSSASVSLLGQVRQDVTDAAVRASSHADERTKTPGPCGLGVSCARC